jgi:curved DNA-binding protein CbpA
MRRDPYRVLGVSRTASSEQLHDAYRRRVKETHPDRAGGSAEAFKEVQEAYDELRNRAAPAHAPNVTERMSRLEDELREAHAARAAANRAAREAAAAAAREAEAMRPRPSEPAPAHAAHEEDSFTKILEDIVDEVAEKLSGARHHPAVQRVEDIIDSLDDLASRLDKKRQ